MKKTDGYSASVKCRCCKSQDRLLSLLIAFRNARRWKQFHSPKNLAVSISIESSELLELFQWSAECNDAEKMKQEIADIGIYLLYFCHDMKINLMQAIEEKIKLNEKKYPIKRARGNCKKYDKL